ncbi:hypothetical protein A9Q81_28365 [Gammaproteobacteria bacterium 42_54_T18]|nr:hypothetical protein A9Q81_28365 [Gammaproteobacteria bacterium 42_54_T18]
MDERTVSFHWRNYRVKTQQRQRIMQLSHDEFIRRFLLHVLPTAFHRIRHYGLVTNAGRKRNLQKARLLLHVPEPTLPEQKAVAGKRKRKITTRQQPIDELNSP